MRVRRRRPACPLCGRSGRADPAAVRRHRPDRQAPAGRRTHGGVSLRQRGTAGCGDQPAWRTL
nr:hypothetical protein [Xanthomonas oryzae]